MWKEVDFGNGIVRKVWDDGEVINRDGTAYKDSIISRLVIFLALAYGYGSVFGVGLYLFIRDFW